MELVTKFTTKELKKLVAQARTNVFDSSQTDNENIVKLPEITLDNESFCHYVEKNNVFVTRNFQPLTDEEKAEWRTIAKSQLKELRKKVKENHSFFNHNFPRPLTNEQILANKISQKEQRKERKEKFSSGSSSESTTALLTDGYYWDYSSLNKELTRDKQSNFIRLIISHGLKKPVMFRITKETDIDEDEDLDTITSYFTIKNIINHILDIYNNKLETITSEFMQNHKIDSLLKCEKNNTWVVDLKNSNVTTTK